MMQWTRLEVAVAEADTKPTDLLRKCILCSWWVTLTEAYVSVHVVLR